jgi:hypothetical protein
MRPTVFFVAMLVAAWIATTSSFAATPITVTITFQAVFEDRDGYPRLVGVVPSAESLKQIELHPGSVVEFTVAATPVVVTEKWTQRFQWKHEHKEGKDTIIEITHQPSWSATRLEWGRSIAPNITLGNATIDIAKGAKDLQKKQREQTQQDFKFDEAETFEKRAKDGRNGVRLGKKPTIKPPPAAPADASPIGPLTLETLDSNGKKLQHGDVIPGCTVTLTIVPAAVQP